MRYSETINCAFCLCKVSFSGTYTSELRNHMQNKHGIVSSIKYAMVSCLLDETEKKVIEERIEGWHNLSMTLSDDVVPDTIAPTKRFYGVLSCLKTGTEKVDTVEKQRSAIYKILEDDDDEVNKGDDKTNEHEN